MRSSAWKWFLALGACAAVGYYLLPDAEGVLWSVLGLSAVAAVVLGVRVYRPHVRGAWYLIAVGHASFALGDVLQFEAGNQASDLAGVFYLVTYVVLTLALMRFIRVRSAGRRDLPSLLDALMITSGLALLAWVFMMGPYARDPNLPLADKVVSMVLPLADVVLLAVLARLWTGGGERRTGFFLLGMAVLALLTADVAFSVVTLNGNFTPGGPIEAGYMVFTITSAASALHPSMRAITAPSPPVTVRMTPMRFVLLAAATLIAPVVLVTEWLQGQQISVLAIAAACVALFVLASARMFGLGREATAQEERGRLLDHTLRATEEERTRIASDLHDGPVQEIVALAYKVSRARRKLAQQDLESVDELVAKVERVLEEQIAAVRRVMADLRPSVLDTRGLEAALRDLASTFESEAGVRTVVEVALDERLPTELETVLFRVAQESLTNIRKHARAGQVNIVLGFDDANATLAVTDDGVGFDTSTAKKLLREGHFGLAGMRERAALIGGQLELRSQPGQGTTVEVSLPVERELVTV